jgi:mycothiol synthase
VDEVHPGSGATVELLRHELETRRETVYLLASIAGERVGAGTGKASSIGDGLYAMARVVVGGRRRGVGGALLAALSAHARVVGRGSLVGRVLEADLEARAFLERRGFAQLSYERAVALDLAGIPSQRPTPPEGLSIVSLAERPDLVPAAYAVEAEAVRDVPTGAERPSPRPFAQWRADTVGAPNALLDLSLVALHGTTAVGWSGLSSTGVDGVAENQLTGVRRAWRGRGFATALKREQAWRARRAGLRTIETTNDDANTPMRAVNERLGFEALPAWLLVRGPLR